MTVWLWKLEGFVRQWFSHYDDSCENLTKVVECSIWFQSSTTMFISQNWKRTQKATSWVVTDFFHPHFHFNKSHSLVSIVRRTSFTFNIETSLLHVTNATETIMAVAKNIPPVLVCSLKNVFSFDIDSVVLSLDTFHLSQVRVRICPKHLMKSRKSCANKKACCHRYTPRWTQDSWRRNVRKSCGKHSGS